MSFCLLVIVVAFAWLIFIAISWYQNDKLVVYGMGSLFGKTPNLMREEGNPSGIIKEVYRDPRNPFSTEDQQVPQSLQAKPRSTVSLPIYNSIILTTNKSQPDYAHDFR